MVSRGLRALASSSARRPGTPPAPRTRTCSKPNSPSRRASERRGVQVQVVGERLAVALEATQQHVQAAVRGGRDQQRALGGQHASQLAHKARRVGDVLNHLARPDKLERAIREGQRPLRLDAAQIDPRAAGPRPLKRRRSHVDPDRLATGGGDRRGQLARAAADIQHALAGTHVRGEEAPAQLQVCRVQLARQAAPELLVVRTHERHASAHICPRSSDPMSRGTPDLITLPKRSRLEWAGHR